MKKISALILFFLFVSLASAEGDSSGSFGAILCKLLRAIFFIAPFLGLLVIILIILSGVKWASSRHDVIARRRARERVKTILVVLVLLLLVVLLVAIILFITGDYDSCVSQGSAGSSSSGSNGGSNNAGGSQSNQQKSNQQSNTASQGSSNSNGGNGYSLASSGGSAQSGGQYSGKVGPYGASYITDLMLYEGWNLISIPLVLNDTNLSSIFSGVDYSVIYSWNPFTQQWGYYMPGIGGNLTELSIDKGYWIHVKKEASITLSGRSPYPFRNISLQPGWNLVSYVGYGRSPVNNTMIDIDYLYLYGWDNNPDSVYGSVWVSSTPLGFSASRLPPKVPVMRDLGFTGMKNLTTLEPDRGYWIYVERNVYWVYPTNYPL